MEVTSHYRELMVSYSPLEVFKFNGREVICIPASLTKNDSCYCADCVFNDSGICDSVSCENMFFVPTNDIPSYVTYKHSPEPSPKEPSVAVTNKRKHK